MKLAVSLFVFCAALSAQIIPGAEGWDGPGLGSARIGVVFGNMACPSVPDAEVNKAVARLALAKWAAAAQIEFYEHADPTALQTIVIAFGFVPAGMRAGSHGPAPPYFEPQAGDVILSDSLPWGLPGSTPVVVGGDLLAVLTHELGHSLGLDHRTDVISIMYPDSAHPWMFAWNDYADPAALQLLYASRTAPPPPPGECRRDCTPVALSVTASAVSTTTASDVAVTGTVSGGTGPYTVTWSTTAGYTGFGYGNPYSATVPLYPGANTITVTVTDSAGSPAATATVSVTRTVDDGRAGRGS